jgi:hypothetical protein
MDEDEDTVVIFDHEMVVNGVTLREKREISTLTIKDVKRITYVWRRTIGMRMLEIAEVKENGRLINRSVDKTMDDVDVKAFEYDWKTYWRPQLEDAEEFLDS